MEVDSNAVGSQGSGSEAYTVAAARADSLLRFAWHLVFETPKQPDLRCVLNGHLACSAQQPQTSSANYVYPDCHTYTAQQLHNFRPGLPSAVFTILVLQAGLAASSASAAAAPGTTALPHPCVSGLNNDQTRVHISQTCCAWPHQAACSFREKVIFRTGASSVLEGCDRGRCKSPSGAHSELNQLLSLHSSAYYHYPCMFNILHSSVVVCLSYSQSSQTVGNMILCNHQTLRAEDETGLLARAAAWRLLQCMYQTVEPATIKDTILAPIGGNGVRAGDTPSKIIIQCR